MNFIDIMKQDNSKRYTRDVGVYTSHINSSCIQ